MLASPARTSLRKNVAMRSVKSEIACILCCLSVALCLVANVSALENSRQVIEEIDVFSDGDFLLMPLTVLGKKHSFVLDTGSDCSVFDVSLPLGPPQKAIRMNTPDGTAETRLFRAPNVMLGTTPLKGHELVVGTDLAELRETQGLDIRGIIGMDVLRNHVIRIDFDHGKVYLQRSAAAAAGEPMPLTFQGLLPNMSIDIAGWEQRVDFRIDTGMLFSGAIRKEMANELVQRKRAVLWYEANATSLSGGTTRSVWRIDELQLRSWKRAQVCLREGNANALGLDYLSRYNITLDFPSKLAYFEKSQRFDHATNLNMTGIRLSQKNGRTWVHSVAAKSRGERAGIRGGDEVVSINGQAADQARLKILDDLLAADEIALIVSRNGRQIEFSLAPSR